MQNSWPKCRNVIAPLHVTGSWRLSGAHHQRIDELNQIRQQIERAIAATDYISDEVARYYYFGKAMRP